VQTKREELLAIGALLLATSAWGGTFVVVKHAIAQMPLMDLMAWRWIIAVAVLVAIRPRCLLVSRATYARGAAVGLTTFFGYLFQTIGLQTTSASVSGFITGMFVVFTPLLMWAFFRERLSASVWIAVALALGGLAALSLRGWSFGVGESWTLLGALFWAGQIITLARWSTRENAYSMATIQLGTAGILFIIGATPGGITLPPSGDVWVGIIILSVFASAIAFSVQTWGQSHLDATRAAVIFSTEPIFASIFGIWIGGDEITARFILGATLIFAGMLISEFGPKRTATAV
jgi:drug/metabolite transporter (DMT)-like permease